MPSSYTGLEKKYNYGPFKNSRYLPSPILFDIIFLTFCNLFLNSQHIPQQNLTTRNESQQRISKLCLGACSEFNMKQRGQSVFELQIQVKNGYLPQTIWLLGLYSRCTLRGPRPLTFYFNVQLFSSDLGGI